MDVGSVPGEIGILLEYREVTGTPRGTIGPSWALMEHYKKTHFRDDNFGNVMEHFYDSTCMTILILS